MRRVTFLLCVTVLVISCSPPTAPTPTLAIISNPTTATAEPTATAMPPTETAQPVATVTPDPTKTPRPSITPQPSATKAIPTQTKPASTLTPMPTRTPLPVMPTKTPQAILPTITPRLVIPTNTPPVLLTPTWTPEPQQGNCDPAYPDFCIPPPPPDLDCKDVRPHKKFRVLPPDPHGFDRDGNGIGCES